MSDSGNILFVSYSHKDEEWLNRLRPHFASLRRHGQLEPWDDRQIKTGDKWYREIKDKVKQARVAVLLISPDFLNSDFCIKDEVHDLLERAEKDSRLLIIPVHLRPCSWELEPWLKTRQMIPGDDKTVVEHHKRKEQYDRFFAKLVVSIGKALKPPVPSVASAVPSPPSPPSIPVDIDRLPTSGRELFGRKDELAFLDEAWASATTTVVSLVAWGGVGKSALVNRWLDDLKKQGWGDAKRVFGWSFYSQGSHTNSPTSADQFIDTALRWFGDPDPAHGSAWNKGERLAELVRQEKTLLVLDGLEPLQWAEGNVGQVKDPALATLLESLAENNPGLVLITTRTHVTGLEDFPGAVDRLLDHLSRGAGRALLRVRGVAGDDRALEVLTAAFDHHALAVALLARFLTLPKSPGVSAIPVLPKLAGKPDRAPRRVLEAFADYYGDGPERQVLRLLGLFDRPAGADEVKAVLASPAIPGLTDQLQTPHRLNTALRDLREAGLIAPANSHDTLDAHPLVRQHFADDAPPEAARAGHECLYRYLVALPKQDQPDTLEALHPLYLAIRHGCLAGLHQEALDEVFWRRIRRGMGAYSIYQLGAFGADLAALAAFFDPPWRRPAAALSAADRSWLLNDAGYKLRGLGRLAEAVEPYRAALEDSIRVEDWKRAAIQAGNFSQLLVTLGRLPEAVAAGRQAVELAERCGEADRRVVSLTTVADALHQSGETAEAGRWFAEAEAMLQEARPAIPLLNSVQGFRYCDLLLGQGQAGEARRRAGQTVIWTGQHLGRVTIALDQLILARSGAALGEAGATEAFTQAVDGLRHAGDMSYLPRGLLARAGFWRQQKQWEKARKDLAEARRIAGRGGMRLYLIDADLEAARLERDELGTAPDPARLKVLAAAIAETGYHRRDGELAELEKAG